MTEVSPRNGKQNGAVLRWHRVLGLTSALFVVFLSVTGVVLNHGPALDLDRRTTDSTWLLDWYGLDIRDELVSYRAGDHWVSWSGDHLFLNGRPVVEHAARLIGALLSGRLIAAAAADELFLLTHEGDLVERLNGAALPGTITRVGVGQMGRMIIETDAGNFRAKPDFASWSPTDAKANWLSAAAAPDPVRQRILVDYRGEGLPWSRVLLDVHSGRIFGTWGPYVMDVTAVILVILAITGFVNWNRRR